MNRDQFTAKIKKHRLDAVLKGAFAGPPTQLKDIPTQSGELRKKQTKAASSAASAKTASPYKKNRA